MDRRNPTVILPHTEAPLLYSGEMDAQYRIHVALPSQYDRGQRRHPVAYVTDGNASFPLMRFLADALASGLEMPRCLVVGIGSDTDDWKEVGRRRAQNFRRRMSQEKERMSRRHRR